VKTINKSFKETVKEVWQAGIGIGRHFVHTLDRMSWPGIVMLCLLTALFLSILPLAMTLFVAVLIVKLAINLFSGKRNYHQEQ